MAYSYGKAPSALRKPFKTPFSKAAAPALAAASQSTAAASQRSQSLADDRVTEKGKGRARDSGVGLVEQVSGESRASRAWTVQWREPQARKNKSWEECVPFPLAFHQISSLICLLISCVLRDGVSPILLFIAQDRG